MANMIKASDFECRHQTLLHLLVVGAAFLSYAFQPDDIVWALIKHHTIYRTLLERLVFGTGALLILCSAAFETWASAYGAPQAGNGTPLGASAGPYRYVQYPLWFGRLLFVLGIGLLAPASGTAILLVGEIALLLRLLAREGASDEALGEYRGPVRRFIPTIRSPFPRPGTRANWKAAIRSEISKWGLAVTMIVFTITLRDRVAEVLGVASFLLWVALNLPEFIGQRRIA